MSGPRPAWIRLRARDGAVLRDFYSRVLGLVAHEGGGALSLPGGGAPVIHLDLEPDAPPRGSRDAGLFHAAFRVPDRPSLARFLRHLRNAAVPVRGTADHGVSEAVYLQDPEGNGLEVYADRPPASWEWRDGEVRMTTEPLDTGGLLATTDGEASLPAGTTLGHLHLRTADLASATEFWTGEVGLDVTASYWPGAAFLASGRYHHHLGLNHWGGPLRRPDPGSAGLTGTGWRVPGLGSERTLEDPDGQRVTLSPA